LLKIRDDSVRSEPIECTIFQDFFYLEFVPFGIA
jgi:hypothetical protein